jgi:Uncharacterized conserved protein
MVTITAPAKKQIREMFRETPRYGLRVHILEWDCQGVKCHISFEDFLAENDIVIEQEGLYIVVDEYALPIFENGTIDYMEPDGGFHILPRHKEHFDRLV